MFEEELLASVVHLAVAYAVLHVVKVAMEVHV